MTEEKKTINPFLKTAGIILCVLAVLLTSFHLWFRNHAEEVIEDLVSARSNGKVNLKLKNFKFNYFSRKMELHNALFYTTDSIDAPVAYRFGVQKLKVEVKSLWQLVFNGKLLIDSLSLLRPDVEVIKLRENKVNEHDISVSQEMGKIYNSIRDALDFLNAGSLLIEDGSFAVINKAEPAKHPVKITHIHFRLDNPNPDLTGKNRPTVVAHNDNMVLRTHNQDIIFPDGSHRISFRNLRINVLKQSIQMDSCTIAAAKDSSRASFSLFFDTLRMATVDFGSLYRKNLIKADTVYCTKPDIKLRIAIKDEKNKNKKQPTLKQIIQPLTGNLDLGYIAILNASIDIAAEKNKLATTFKSENDNIEVTGLKINSDSSEPMSVKGFSMAIRDYETINRNRTLAFRFDSVKFNNGQFILSNFTVKTLPSRHEHDAERNYIVPRLELSNLSWDELLFNRSIKASKAVLYSPVMNYKRLRPGKTNQKVALFRDLSNIDAMMELQQLQVINGKLNMELDQRTKINLENTNMSVSSNELLGSKNIKSLQRSFNQLQFLKGVITINELKAELKNVHFTGKQDQIEADEVTVYDPSKTLSAVARNVLMNEIYYNDSTKSLSVDGFEWQQATVQLGSFPKQTKPSKSSVVLKNIAGNNTTLLIQTPEQTINTFVRSVTMDELRKPVNAKTTISGLRATGNNFNIVQRSLWIETEAFDITDKDSSLFTNACIEQRGTGSSFVAAMPLVKFIPDIQEVMKGTYRFDNITIDKPVIAFTGKSDSTTKGAVKKLEDFSVGSLILENPAVYFEKDNPVANRHIQWYGSMNNSAQNKWQFSNIISSKQARSINIDKIKVRGTDFFYSVTGGKHFSIADNTISAEAENIIVKADTDDTWNWSAKVNNLSIEKLDNTVRKSKRGIVFEGVSGQDIFISSANSSSITVLLQDNPSFTIRNNSGHYIDSSNTVRWSNLVFDQKQRSLSVDSFLFKPILPRDSFINSHPFQSDYITISTGKMTLLNTDLSYYISDSIIKAGTLIAEHPVITAYRDNLSKTFDPGHMKPLPTELVKKFPLFISLDSIYMLNGTVTYSQLEKTTGMVGVVPLTDLNARLSLVRNYDLKATDSMELNATAKLVNDISVKLVAKESYEDPLGGIRLLLNTGGTDLKKINSMLIPLISVKIKSGYADTVSMDASANEYLAFGQMNMRYKNLKIAILNKGNENTKGFKTWLINFAANTLLVKNKNTGRKGIVYFERNRDRSFFNYLVKMFFRGMANSVGLKIDKKKIKKHQRELKKSDKENRHTA